MGFRILMIEDNPDNLELMRYLLKAFGHTPLTAEEGAEGIELARRENPDLIICDIQLPGMSGYEVAKALKADGRLAGIPLVAVTALAMVGDRDRILAAGFDGYISKPIVPETFLKQVEVFLTPGGAVRPGPAAAAPVMRPPNAPHVPPNGIRILAVDDCVVNLDFVHDTLGPLGYEVVRAAGTLEALAAARKEPPHLILSDIHMPESDGFDLFAAIRREDRLRTIPFVFISSAVQMAHMREKCLALGADRFIARPVGPQSLISEIEATLAKARKAEAPQPVWRKS